MFETTTVKRWTKEEGSMKETEKEQLGEIEWEPYMLPLKSRKEEAKEVGVANHMGKQILQAESHWSRVPWKGGNLISAAWKENGRKWENESRIIGCSFSAFWWNEPPLQPCISKQPRAGFSRMARFHLPVVFKPGCLLESLQDTLRNRDPLAKCQNSYPADFEIDLNLYHFKASKVIWICSQV